MSEPKTPFQKQMKQTKIYLNPIKTFATGGKKKTPRMPPPPPAIMRATSKVSLITLTKLHREL
jgi:hypothetical protein